MRRENGQVGLLILVVMGVLVSLVLSVASRSLSDLVLSRQEKEQSEAFNVAEQGVDTALNVIRQDPSAGEGGQYAGNVSAGTLVTGGFTIDTYGGLDLFVNEGEVAEIDLTGSSNLIDIYWTKKGDEDQDVECDGEGSGNSPAALEVIHIVSANDPIERDYYSAFDCDLSADNGFDKNASDGGLTYRSTVRVNKFSTRATKLRFRPLYNGATIAVSADNLTSQLYLINSSASGGDSQKDIEVKRTYDSAASIFDFALFTKGTVVK